jgi:hypothetical protein
VQEDGGEWDGRGHSIMVHVGAKGYAHLSNGHLSNDEHTQLPAREHMRRCIVVATRLVGHLEAQQQDGRLLPLIRRACVLMLHVYAHLYHEHISQVRARMQRLYACSIYTHAASIRMQHLYACSIYTHASSIRMQHLYACSIYSTAQPL